MKKIYTTKAKRINNAKYGDGECRHKKTIVIPIGTEFRYHSEHGGVYVAQVELSSNDLHVFVGKDMEGLV